MLQVGRTSEHVLAITPAAGQQVSREVLPLSIGRPQNRCCGFFGWPVQGIASVPGGLHIFGGELKPTPGKAPLIFSLETSGDSYGENVALSGAI
jgi:hypothetical protein